MDPVQSPNSHTARTERADSGLYGLTVPATQANVYGAYYYWWYYLIPTSNCHAPGNI